MELVLRQLVGLRVCLAQDDSTFNARRPPCARLSPPYKTLPRPYLIPGTRHINTQELLIQKATARSIFIFFHIIFSVLLKHTARKISCFRPISTFQIFSSIHISASNKIQHRSWQAHLSHHFLRCVAFPMRHSTPPRRPQHIESHHALIFTGIDCTIERKGLVFAHGWHRC